jgi:Phosphotransferase enzyme family
LTTPVDAEALRRWLRARSVSLGRRRRLTGGVASPLVERVDVRAELADGRYVDRAVLAKRASPAELVAMREIAYVEGVSTFPELLDAGTDEAGPWLVTPFYAGATLPWNAEPPPAVYADLARLHATWMGRTSELPADVPRVDAEFCRHALLEFASGGLGRLPPGPVVDRGLELLHKWANDDRLYAGLERLPVTFLHGDVYGLNILVADDGSPPRLIDWGSARIGPAVLDVVVTANGAGGYRRSWQDATGKPLDPWLFEVGRAWATWFSDGMFVGAVAERFGPEPAAAMLDEGETALVRLGELLANGPAAGAG